MSKYFSSDYDVTVLTTEPQYPNSELYRNKKDWQSKVNENIKVIRVSTKKKSYKHFLMVRLFLYLEVFIKLFRGIHNDLSKEKYDFIFVSSPPLSIPLLGIYAKYKFKAKLILDVRDLWPETLTAIKSISSLILQYISYPLEKKIYQSSNSIIVNSEAFIPYIREIIGPDKEIVFIPNSLTTKEFNYDKKYENKETIQIIYAGNLGIAQDLSVFLELANAFKNNNIVKFVLMGYGIYSQDIIDTVKKRNLTNIEILQPEPRAKVLERMKESDIAYIGLENQSAFHTVIPGKLIDYMGAGLPIIALTYGYSRKIIEEADAGIVLNLDDGIDDWVKSIEGLIYHSDVRRYYGENSRIYAQKHFDWDSNQNLLGKVLKNLDD
ncbi:glycosyltransferase family 4 protein [Enterococcus faecium]|uniref:glycosyltransferase family 4 protein n=1 Tax=Enterococcus faecium TaxID=1352 RepID=UPI001D0EBBF5|nr:glycosyltransferase family 4 protein [Enterococcus faecium]